METFPAPGELGDDDWRELNERADRFAVLVAGGPVDDWEEHLTGLLPPVRFALLVELVKIDLAEGWKRGRKPILDDYRARFRELADPKKIPNKQEFHQVFGQRLRYCHRKLLKNDPVDNPLRPRVRMDRPMN